MHRLFVYGTLLSGECNQQYMNGGRLVAGNATIAGQLVDTGYGYPGLVEEPGTVAGEIYEISDEALRRIDALEDYFGPGDSRNLYERVRVTAVTANGVTLDVWTYVYLPREYGQVRFGDWKRHRAATKG